jgi:hypothetical protein
MTTTASRAKDVGGVMKRLISLALAALATPMLAVSCAAAQDQGPAVERANPDPEASEEYWTPERLERARPLPLPHPSTPPPRSQEAPQPGPAASVSEGGSLGSGDVVPDQSNYLFPSDLLPNDPSTPD